MDEVTIKGVTFRKTTILAKKYGYTTDYLGQLARAKKIRAKLIGRSWYVEEQSLADYKEGIGTSESEMTPPEAKTAATSAVKLSVGPERSAEDSISPRPVSNNHTDKILVYPRNFNSPQNEVVKPGPVPEPAVESTAITERFSDLPEIKYFPDNSELDVDRNPLFANGEDNWRVLAVDEKDRPGEIELSSMTEGQPTSFNRKRDLEISKLEPKKKITKKGRIKIHNNVEGLNTGETGTAQVEEVLVLKSKIPSRPQVAKRIKVSRITTKTSKQSAKNSETKALSGGDHIASSKNKKCEFTPKVVNENKRSTRRGVRLSLGVMILLVLLYLGSFTLGLKITTDLVNNHSVIIFNPGEVWQVLSSYF